MRGRCRGHGGPQARRRSRRSGLRPLARRRRRRAACGPAGPRPGLWDLSGLRRGRGRHLGACGACRACGGGESRAQPARRRRAPRAKPVAFGGAERGCAPPPPPPNAPSPGACPRRTPPSPGACPRRTPPSPGACPRSRPLQNPAERGKINPYPPSHKGRTV